MGRPLRLAVVGAAVALASCSGGTAATTTSPATTSAATSPPSATETPATTKAEPTTTTLLDATTSTTPDSTTPETTPPGGPPLPGQIVAALDTDLALVGLPSGEATTIVPFFNGDGIFRAGLVLDPGGETLYFSEGYEDYWYGCESSRGASGKVDLATGEMSELGDGYSPTPSPNGSLVARLYAETCFPDPENPDLWVLTAVDTVIVTDENGDDPVEHGIGVTPTTPDDPAALTWVGWESDTDLLVLTAGGVLHRVPLGSTQPISDHPQVASGLDGVPVGLGADGLVMVRYAEDFASATVVAFDLTSGDETELAATTASVSVGVDALGRPLIAEIVNSENESGADAQTALHLPDGTRIVLDLAIRGVDW